MRILILSFAIVLFSSFCPTAYAENEWNPDTAINDAREEFKMTGYGSIAVTDSTRKSYYGDKVLPQDTIFCALEDTDMKLFVHIVDSIEKENIRNYVTLYNTEMLKLQAAKRGCKR